MLIYVGAVMSIMYYLGFTQSIASKIGWVMQATMGSTAIESLSVGAGIFLNGVSSSIILKRLWLDSRLKTWDILSVRSWVLLLFKILRCHMVYGGLTMTIFLYSDPFIQKVVWKLH